MIDAPQETEVDGELHVRGWRRVWLATSMGTLKCADGHHLKDPIVFDHGCIRCRGGLKQAGGARCDKLTYIIAGLRGLRGEHLVLCADVEPREMRHMAEAHMRLEDVIAYLGVLL